MMEATLAEEEYGDLTDLDVSDPPELTPAEKEVTVRVARDQGSLWVSSEVGSVTRRLMAHEGFHVESVRVDDETVTSVVGRLPVRYLTIGTAGRSHDRLAEVVSAGVLE